MKLKENIISDNETESIDSLSESGSSQHSVSECNVENKSDFDFIKPPEPPKEKFKKPVLVGPRKPKKGSLIPKVGTSTTVGTAKTHVEEIPEPEKCFDTSLKEVHANEESIEEQGSISSVTEVEINFQSGKVDTEDTFPYTEPSWKGLPEAKYFLEELKGGVIEREIDLTERSFSVLGRLDGSHITLAHPSVSRYHAVIQYRKTRQGIYDKGFYLYDLGSTHGTFLNKSRIKPQTYVRIQVGHMIKLGCSSRFLILQGPEDDQEAESEFTVTELKEKRQQELLERKQKVEEAQKLKVEMEKKLKEDLERRGVDWGMGEDADEETDLSENPYAVTTNEELYIDDPKKELRKWFEREGHELSIEVEQAERGKIACRIVLPFDNERGGDVVIEGTGKSKKEATSLCALDACRYIDKLGLFRQSNQEARKRQVRDWEENDFYDSDEDSFFDRTGQLEEKRQKRMKKAGKLSDVVQTFETLTASHTKVLESLAEAEKKLEKMSRLVNSNNTLSGSDVDELDAYMHSLKHHKPNKLEIKACKIQIDNLKEEEAQLVKLINIAKPATVPNLKPLEKYSKPRSDVNALNKTSSETNRMVERVQVQPQEITSVNTSESIDEKNENIEQNSASTTSNQPRKIGPLLPSNDYLVETEKKKKSRTRHKTKIPKVTKLESEDDYNNLTWKPPEGQTGDGRTSLNEKFGY